MTFRIVAAAAIAAIVFANGSASAAKMTCTDQNIAKADEMVMKMPDGPNKTAGMQEMTSAKSSMSQKDMAGCQTHMNKAMKMGSTKGKKA
jgi:hypothetical protein